MKKIDTGIYVAYGSDIEGIWLFMSNTDRLNSDVEHFIRQGYEKVIPFTYKSKNIFLTKLKWKDVEDNRIESKGKVNEV